MIRTIRYIYNVGLTIASAKIPISRFDISASGIDLT